MDPLLLPDDLLDPAAWRGLALPTERIAACARELEGVTDPKDAWETLAARGWIPPEAVDDPSRVFRAVPVLTTDAPSTPTARHPPDVASALRMAAMWRSVLHAEALAREARQRFLAWQFRARRRTRPATATTRPLRWFFGEPAYDAFGDLEEFAGELARRAPEANRRAWEDVEALLGEVPPVVAARLRSSLQGHRLLRRPIEGPSEARSLRSMLVAPSEPGALPDPFEPQLLAYTLGGWFLEVTRPEAAPVDLWVLHDPLAPPGAWGIARWHALGSR